MCPRESIKRGRLRDHGSGRDFRSGSSVGDATSAGLCFPVASASAASIRKERSSESRSINRHAPDCYGVLENKGLNFALVYQLKKLVMRQRIAGLTPGPIQIPNSEDPFADSHWDNIQTDPLFPGQTGAIRNVAR